MSLQQKNSTVLVKHGLLMASTLAAEATKAEGTASILWTAVVNMYYWGDNYKMQTSHTLCSRPKRYGALQFDELEFNPCISAEASRFV